MPIKPLGIKSYGSIAHLPGSRLGSGDHHCHEGQARICLEKPRDKHDVIIVQEKVDGSNVGIALTNDIVTPLIRSGYTAVQSHYPMHHWFHNWVMEREDVFRYILNEGERICGEWMAQAHGTMYANCEPFYAFDLFTADNKRLNFNDFQARLNNQLPYPHTLHMGGPFSIENVEKALGVYGHHGALEPAEGAVYRVERKGIVDFLAKYVRSDKVDGKYLDGEPVYNWHGWRK